MESLLQDMRFGARMLAKNPGFTLIAMLTLSLGIGAKTAIFSVVNAVLLRPLPYENPERLVMIWETNAKEQNNEATASFDDYTDFRRANQHFEQVGATTARWQVNLTEAGEARQVGCMFVSANVFPMLGVKPQAGRFFTDDEDKPGGPDVVVLSRSMWLQQIGGIAHGLEQQFPNTNSGIGVRLVSLHEQVTGKVNTLLWLLLGAVVLVLLIACVNVANLMLAQASARQKEIAIRLALGAGRRRLIRQLLIESSMLAVISGALGTLLAVSGIDLLLALSPGNLPRQSSIHVDWAALAFALAVSLLTGLVAGLAPALLASRGKV